MPNAYREALAVFLVCLGLLTMLSLLSYQPEDASLNASGAAQVRNWIGPAGSYWADLLLQGLGLSAYLLGIGCLLAGYRAFFRRAIVPPRRETLGFLALIICGGAFAHLLLARPDAPYPPGGVLGAILGRLLLDQFAVAGAYIIAIGTVLIALALTVDGILMGLTGGGSRLMMLLHAQSQRVIAWMRARKEARAKAEKKARRSRKDGARPGEEPGLASDEPPLSEDVLAAATGAAVSDESRGVSTWSLPSHDLIGSAALGPKVLGAPVAAALTEAELVDDESEASSDGDDDDDEIDDEADDAADDDGADDDDDEEDTDEAAASSPSGHGGKSKKRGGANEPMIVDARPQVDISQIQKPVVLVDEVTPGAKEYALPSTSLLDFQASVRATVDPQRLRENALRLTQTLKNYGIEGHVREIRPGPVVTMYEYVPGPGIKLSRIAGLADDLAMSMEALRVRIVAPIPGKGAVGIEIPNEDREMVFLKELFAHEIFQKARSKLTLALGKDIEGNPYVANLARMPHLLVAGATGAGKSVSINSMIMSILFKATPAEVRMIMVDPKMLELSVYDGIPHLLLPVVTDPKKAALALRWAVAEMERRYQVLSDAGVRSIDSFNKKIDMMAEEGRSFVVPARRPGEQEQILERMPYILVIVDELADLMMVASRDVETAIMRLAQMARAAGIHLILATQRPSVDVLTGVIKANFPTRIAFQVASRHDSRTIIDGNGAEHLLGRGDMLYLSPGAGGLVRVHGAYVSDEEIERTVAFLREQGTPQYDESILTAHDDGEESDVPPAEKDEFYDQAVAIVAETRQASISMIQRRLRIGYNRAARMVEQMESDGIVGPADGAKPREVLVSSL